MFALLFLPNSTSLGGDLIAVLRVEFAVDEILFFYLAARAAFPAKVPFFAHYQLAKGFKVILLPGAVAATDQVGVAEFPALLISQRRAISRRFFKESLGGLHRITPRRLSAFMTFECV